MANSENMLLGAWIYGDKREDIKLFSEEDFQDRKLFKALSKGIYDTYQLSKLLSREIGDIASLVSAYTDKPFMYETWFAEKWDHVTKSKIARNKDDPQKLAEELNRINEIYEERKSPKEEGKNYGLMVIDELNKRAKQPKVTWGVSVMDKLMTSMMPGELTTIAARPSVGKSTIMLQIARHIAEQGQKVLFYPLEMSALAILQRIVMSETDIPSDKMKTGDLTADEWELMGKACDVLYSMYDKRQFLIIDSTNKIERIKEDIEKQKPYAVFIDQLTQLDAERGFKDPRARFSYMTRTLKRIALEEGVSIVLACQLNRAAQEKMPSLADLKESGSIEEDSDNVILIHRYSVEEAEKRGFKITDETKPLRFEVAKQREGATGSQDMYSVGGKFTFLDITQAESGYEEVDPIPW